MIEFVLNGDISRVPVNQINTGGYVIESLEAALWCFLNTSGYKEAVLASVNLGQDTDTTAAITGGLAAICYGYYGIPNHWIEKLARLDDIIQLGMKLENINL